MSFVGRRMRPNSAEEASLVCGHASAEQLVEPIVGTARYRRGVDRAIQTHDWRCPSIAHRPDRGDRGRPRCRRPEPSAGAWTPELCPYRLNNRLGWGYCVHVPSCPASVQHSRLGLQFRRADMRGGAVAGLTVPGHCASGAAQSAVRDNSDDWPRGNRDSACHTTS
jgi:hypothetical protein